MHYTQRRQLSKKQNKNKQQTNGPPMYEFCGLLRQINKKKDVMYRLKKHVDPAGISR